MPQINNYPGGFAHGITIRGMPVAVTHPGHVFWVSNSGVLGDRQIGSSNGNKGTYDAPMSTLAAAISAAKADRGDLIMVKPGHAETVSAAAGIVLSKAGVAIIGLGTGSKRPTITFDTANTATITVTANNVTVSNFLFKANFLDIATCFSIANAQVATDLTIDNCEFRDNSVILNWMNVIRIGTTSNIADGFVFSNNRYIGIAQTTEPASRCQIVLGSDIDRMQVLNNFVVYPKLLADKAWLIQYDALNMTNVLVRGNMGFKPNTSTTDGSMMNGSATACSGLVIDNYDWHIDATGLLIKLGTKLGFANNFSSIAGAADRSMQISPLLAA